jgi:NAD(P)-dependent dehydrogenase (short-subunit alcohol dehydrogenase family)
VPSIFYSICCIFLLRMAEGRVCVVTGAAGGIGRAMCSAFQDAGYRVVGTDVKDNATVGDVFIPCDLVQFSREPVYRNSILEQFRHALRGGLLHALINNAAVQLLNSTDRLLPEEFYKTLDVNVVAPLLLIQGLLPELERARGSVVNVSSVHSTVTKPGFVAYATSKAALSGLTRALAVDLGPRVRVNAIEPAATDTPMLRRGFEKDEDALKRLGAMHPMARIAEPAEVAAVALFLVSEHATFVTGATVAVDGGIRARLHDPS